MLLGQRLECGAERGKGARGNVSTVSTKGGNGLNNVVASTTAQRWDREVTQEAGR